MICRQYRDLSRHTSSGQGRAASQGVPNTRVTLGASYKSRLVADPDTSMLTRSCTTPTPGPGGAWHTNSPSPTTSVIVTLVQRRAPTVTSMIGLAKKFCAKDARCAQKKFKARLCSTLPQYFSNVMYTVKLHCLTCTPEKAS
jgi:hypothetical protein